MHTSQAREITYGIKCRIYPTLPQKRYLAQNIGCSRLLYNLYVDEGKERDKQAAIWHEQNPDKNGQAYPYKWKNYTDYYPGHPFLKDVDTRALLNAKRNYFDARKRHYTQDAGKPRYHSKKRDKESYTTSNQNYKGSNGTRGNIRVITDEQHQSHKTYLIIPGCVRGAKVGPIRIKLSRQIKGDIVKATITHEKSGKWSVSLTIRAIRQVPEPRDIKDGQPYRVFGGDLGVHTFLTGTDGVSYDDPHDYEKLERKLKKEERKLGKQRARLLKHGRNLRECRNYQKQRRKVARLYERLRNARADFRHKLSRRLVESQDMICLEDLNVKGMMRNHSLAGSVAGRSFADFVRMVSYKAGWYGSRVVKVGRFFPSTRRCHKCGGVTGPQGLSDLGVREWSCSSCGAVLDRDGNASWNVLLEGLRLSFGERLSDLVLCVNRWDGGVSLVSGSVAGELAAVPDMDMYTLVVGGVDGSGESVVPRKCPRPEFRSE